jgi:hypothetical protein
VEARQIGGDVLGQAIGEPRLRRVAAQKAERQDDHRRPLEGLVGRAAAQRRASVAGRHHGAGRILVHLEGVDRLGDVLERLGAEIGVAEVELVADLVVHGSRDAHASRPCQSFDAGRDIDAVAAGILGAQQHFAKVDADAKQQLAVLRHALVERLHPLLGVDGETHRIHGTVEQQKQPVAADLQNSSTVGFGAFVEGLYALLDGLPGADLVLAHQARIVGDVGKQNRAQPPFGSCLIPVVHRPPHTRWRGG